MDYNVDVMGMQYNVMELEHHLLSCLTLWKFKVAIENHHCYVIGLSTIFFFGGVFNVQYKHST